MLRVLGTIQHSQYSNKMKNEMKDLQNWVTEILGGMYSNVVRFGHSFFLFIFVTVSG